MASSPDPASAAETTDGAAGETGHGTEATAPTLTATALDAVTLLVRPAVPGRERVRLAGILAPPSDDEAAPADRSRGSEDWPEAARIALAQLVAGQALTLAPTSAEPDRYRRLVAHVHRARDGLWLQGALVARGLALVAFASDADSLRLLPLEDEARRAGRGLWGERRFRVLASDEAHRHLGEVAIIEGVVHQVARNNGWLYLNFGEDWRKDFTASVRARAVPAFAKAGVSLPTLAGQRVRVRGFVDKRNGPSLELFERTQIEVLTAEAPPLIPPAAIIAPAGAPPGR